MPEVTPPKWRWTRLLRRGQEDEWLERLAVLEPGEGFISAKGENGRPKVDIYAIRKGKLTPWLKEYGGRIVPVRKADLHLPHVVGGPIRIGRDLVVLPAEELEIPTDLPAEVRVLRVPPNMAFGTGEHATTGMMLRHMAGLSLWQQGKVSVLDAGTGSGVLALAARHWGAETIAAFDSEEVAIRIARENELQNFGSAAIDFSATLMENFRRRRKFDLVVVNLYSELLIQSAARLSDWLKPGATLIASGILNRQESGVAKAFRQAGLKLMVRKRRGRWVMQHWVAK